MTDPTQATPIVGGTPPAGPPPTEPPTGGPGGPGDPGGPGGPGGPEEPDEGGGMDRRLVAILGLLGAIVVLLVILLLVIANDDGDDDASPATTTSTTLPATTGESTTTTSESTTTTEATTTTTTEATTTTTTTTTTAPPPTIAPARCVGADGTDDPDDTAIVFYDTWTIDDEDCASKVATPAAVDRLFEADGSSADWDFEGCGGDLLGDDPVECTFGYGGGEATFEMDLDDDDRWRVAAVGFVTTNN